MRITEEAERGRVKKLVLPGGRRHLCIGSAVGFVARSLLETRLYTSWTREIALSEASNSLSLTMVNEVLEPNATTDGNEEADG